ncbi:MAG: CHAD domain-containing protein, partial [Burkholderiales bacterium]|nr:CHAD domain-containing protein [Burkholderiales bacterium]
LREPAASAAAPAAGGDEPSLAARAQHRLRRWHRRIVGDGAAFAGLEDERIHALRKRVKRQRYAVEFFAPLLREGGGERYLAALAAVQDRMGELNDLFVARALFQGLAETDPAAGFALGWLAARIAAARARVAEALAGFGIVEPPRD